MYEFSARVRYSEINEERELTLLALINYLQDCSNFHSSDGGVTLENMIAHHEAWLLSYWDIYVKRLPEVCENITVGTCPHPPRGILVNRNFWIRNGEDYLVKAVSYWFHLNTDNMRPGKITDRELAPFGEQRDVLGLPQSKRKLEVPEDLKEAEAVKVAYHHLDSNHHVNNAQYITIAFEALKELGLMDRFAAGRIRAEYRRAAVAGDIMVPKAGTSEDGLVVSLQDPDGDIFANVAFTGDAMP